MRYPASEKLEIIRLVEQSHLPVRRVLEQIGGQVRGLLDIFTWVASFEVFALRPTRASYS
jgi:hypothetical protein